MTKKFFCLLLIILTLGLIFLPAHPAFAKTEEEYAKEIADLEAKISAARQTSQTLAGQIAYYDGQISLTSLKIAQTEELITSITSKILLLEDKLQSRSEVLEKQIVQTYKQGSIDPMQILFSSTSFSEIISRFKYSQLLQLNNRKFLHDTQKVQSNYGQQKTLIEDSKKRLIAQQTSLASLRKDRDRLLSQTKNDEATYQRLLSEARAQLAAMADFTRGAFILKNQTFCDEWGCYYNQRDSKWANLLINLKKNCPPNESEPCTMARFGCLISSVAMVSSHYKKNITPDQIAMSSGDNFSVSTADLRYSIVVNGISINRTFSANIDQQLAVGTPVIVGINKGPAHFVVFKSGSKGNYIMNDPYIENGHDVKFSDHYSSGSITYAGTLVF